MRLHLPMRLLFPLITIVFATMVTGAYYLVERVDHLAQVEREVSEELGNRLTSMQSTLRLLLELRQRPGVERMVSAFGAKPDNRVMLLGDDAGEVIASTHRGDIGRALEGRYQGLDMSLAREAIDQRRVVTRLSADGRWFDGYASVCRSGGDGLRDLRCGLLFHRIDYRYHVGRSLADLNGQTLFTALTILVLAVLLSLMLQLLLTRRTERLAAVVASFSEGARTVRCHMGGDDELARMASAVDVMMDRLVEDEAELRLAREVFINAGEAIVITDAQSRVIDVNPAYERTTGYQREEILGKNPNQVSSGRHDKAFYQRMWSALMSEGHWAGEIWDRRKDGDVYPKWLSISVIRDAEGQPSHYVGIFKDITLQKETEERLQNLAYYDALTQLPNRLLFKDRLRHELDVSDRHQGGAALFFIDLDRFKQVNDTLGHDIGDDLLVAVAGRIRECLRAVDTVARLGGDEFTVILSEIDDREAIGRVAGNIIDALQRVFILRGHEVFIGASIGIGLYPDDGADMESLIKSADEAMYRAKNAGRGNYQFASK